MVAKTDIFVFDVHFTALLFEIIAAIAVLFIAIKVFQKWRERRTIATLYLSIALFSIAIAAFIAFTGLFSWFVAWINSGYIPTISTEYYPLSLPIGYSFVIPYGVFMVLFTIQIFLDKNDKKVIPFVVIGVIIGALLFLPTNYWGRDAEGAFSTRVIILGLFLLYNTIIYVLLTYYAFRESKRTEQEVYRKGFQAIALGFIANLMVFVFFLLDSILILIDDTSPGYSIFVDLAWISGLVAAFLFYLGYILPEWFRKRYEK